MLGRSSGAERVSLGKTTISSQHAGDLARLVRIGRYIRPSGRRFDPSLARAGVSLPGEGTAGPGSRRVMVDALRLSRNRRRGNYADLGGRCETNFAASSARRVGPTVRSNR